MLCHPPERRGCPEVVIDIVGCGRSGGLDRNATVVVTGADSNSVVQAGGNGLPVSLGMCCEKVVHGQDDAHDKSDGYNDSKDGKQDNVMGTHI